MKALIFSIISLSLICPKKSTTALPVITLYILLSLSFSVLLFGFFVVIVPLFVCLNALFFLGLA